MAAKVGGRAVHLRPREPGPHDRYAKLHFRVRDRPVGQFFPRGRKERYEKPGGRVELIVKKGVGHRPHSPADPAPLVDYLLKNRLKD